MRTFYVYILTDRHRRILYTGMTNNLERRIHEHRTQRMDNAYSARHALHYLVYFESHSCPSHAYAREWAIKRMSREQRDALIRAFEADEVSCPPHLRNPYAPPGWAEKTSHRADEQKHAGMPWQRADESKLIDKRADESERANEPIADEPKRGDKSAADESKHASEPFTDESMHVSRPRQHADEPKRTGRPTIRSDTKAPRIIPPRSRPICPW